MRRAITLLLAAGAAHAGCIVGDHSSVNKSLHLIGNGVIVITGDSLTKNEWAGPAAAVAVSAFREVWKSRQPGMSCEYSSITYDLVGIGLGAVVGHHILITPQRGGASVTYTTAF